MFGIATQGVALRLEFCVKCICIDISCLVGQDSVARWNIPWRVKTVPAVKWKCEKCCDGKTENDRTQRETSDENWSVELTSIYLSLICNLCIVCTAAIVSVCFPCLNAIFAFRWINNFHELKSNCWPYTKVGTNLNADKQWW